MDMNDAAPATAHFMPSPDLETDPLVVEDAELEVGETRPEFVGEAGLVVFERGPDCVGEAVSVLDFGLKSVIPTPLH